MAGHYRKSRSNLSSSRRLILILALGFLLMVLLLTLHSVVTLIPKFSTNRITHTLSSKNSNLPTPNELSISLQKRNLNPPKNTDLYPNLPQDHIVMVLYVHNRPQYLQVVVDSLSQVQGINETLLIVSHDGYFHDMNSIIERINFCQVKQIFMPYSPHIFPNSFPGPSPFDCRDEGPEKCEGTKDQYGNYRSPKIVSLKHHWWWMMNTVWDGLGETRAHSGHIVFIEEDHFIYPNAYRNLGVLVGLKPEKCPHCYAVNLAPSNVLSRGEAWDLLVAEKIGNVGYAFNRTVWRKIHKMSAQFCSFDDYNWDITMWAAVYPSFGERVHTLRGPRTSAVHFGRCGLHQGKGGRGGACVEDGGLDLEIKEMDRVVNVKSGWAVYEYAEQEGYRAGFKGWGGMGRREGSSVVFGFRRHLLGVAGNFWPEMSGSWVVKKIFADFFFFCF